MSEQTEWGYSGDKGPENWGNLSEDFRPCSEGQTQSPIDLHPEEAVVGEIDDVSFNYASTALRIFNNGHTVRVDCDPGSSVTFNDVEYPLVQFHLHHPSEHTIDEVAADMELHLVHETDDGQQLNIAILLYAGEEPTQGYLPIFENLPNQVSSEAPETAGISINLDDLLPPESDFYAYTGSLTTPPCTEGVQWIVMKRGVVVSEENIRRFAGLFANNARPVQDMNGRKLYYYESTLL